MADLLPHLSIGQSTCKEDATVYIGESFRASFHLVSTVLRLFAAFLYLRVN